MKNQCLAICLLVTGCQDSKPEKIEIYPPRSAVFTKEPFNLNARVVTAGGEPAAATILTYAAIPTDVVRVSPVGDVACEKTGDATVTIAGGGLNAVTTINCRLVATLKAKKEIRAIIGAEPADLALEALGADGARMSDVPIAFEGFGTYADVNQSGKLSGKSVGRFTLISKVGTVSARTEVQVIEKIESKPIVIPDGSSITYSLQTGRYQIEIQAKAGNNGVSASWVGVPCENQPEKQEHRFDCVVENTATLTVSNPALFGFGSSATGFLNIYRIP
jgi:hypothetical protein